METLSQARAIKYLGSCEDHLSHLISKIYDIVSNQNGGHALLTLDEIGLNVLYQKVH